MRRTAIRNSRRAALLAAVAIHPGIAAASPAPTLANPAAVFCGERGGRVEIEIVADGGQKGVCVFPDGRRVDEWVYFRNMHRTTH